jgi:hypothetical protein
LSTAIRAYDNVRQRYRERKKRINTNLSRPNKFQMKRTGFPKSINEIYWLLSLYLTRNSGKDILKIKNDLKNLHIPPPKIAS